MNDSYTDKTIAVIGASGKSGRAFVSAALASGYKVRAGVRSGMLPAAEGLTVIKCDATVADDVANLLQGSSAVVSLIGHVKNSPATVQTDAMRTVTEQMKLQHITRIVSLTGTGVRVRGDTPSLLDRFANSAIKFVDPKRISDGVQHAELLKNSELAWTIIRVLKLTMAKADSYTLTEHGPAKLFTPRDEVAQAILETLENDMWIQSAPVIGKSRT